LKSAIFSTFLDLSDLDRGSGHTAYHCVSLIDLCLHTKIIETGQLFLCTDGWTVIEAGFIRMTWKLEEST